MNVGLDLSRIFGQSLARLYLDRLHASKSSSPTAANRQSGPAASLARPAPLPDTSDIGQREAPAPAGYDRFGRRAGTPSAPAPGPSTAAGTFFGTFRNGTIEFDGIRMKFADDGKIAIYMRTPSGQILGGAAERQDDGSYLTELSNGQRYSFRLEADATAGTAQISDLRLLGS